LAAYLFLLPTAGVAVSGGTPRNDVSETGISSVKQPQIPDEQWHNNGLGLEDKVLWPWTPLSVSNNKVSCWGRDYFFAASSLPESIISAGKEILSRPVKLTVTSGGKNVAWTHSLSAVKLTPKGTKASLSSFWSGASAGKQALSLHAQVSVEFDGLILYEISVAGVDAKKIDSIVIDIPIVNELALYRHKFGWAWKDIASYSGSLPPKKGVVESSKFLPYYWFGDNDRGLFWFCESDSMWPNGSSDDAIQVIRTSEELIFRLLIKKASQALPSNWKLVFGLQATPVKPLPKNWRGLRLAPARNANVSIIWPEPKKDSLLYYGYPEAADYGIFAERIKKLDQMGIAAAPYVCLTHVSTASPEWKKYSSLWSVSQYDAASADVRAFGSPFAMVSPAAPSWSDFIVWKTKQFIDRYGLSSIYHDNTQPYPIASPATGVGYIRQGKPKAEFPILHYRSLYRRMYSVMKSNPKPTLTIAHISSKLTIPLLAFTDAYLDGEQFADVVKDDYMDVLALDAFRSEFIGRQWGLIPIFLPEFRRPYSEATEPTRGLMALLMLHDVLIWPQWCNVEMVNAALYGLDDFGYFDAEFIPYFDPIPPATSTLKDVYVSAYKKTDGKVLLIIANLSRENRTGQLFVNARRLGREINKIITWPDKRPVSSKGDGLIELSIPRHGYRMIVLD